MGRISIHGGYHSGRKVLMNEGNDTSLHADYGYRGERNAGFRADVVSRHPSLPTICVLD